VDDQRGGAIHRPRETLIAAFPCFLRPLFWSGLLIVTDERLMHVTLGPFSRGPTATVLPDSDVGTIRMTRQKYAMQKSL
jgi:hypothetical protein